ncbi:ABC transporter permease [Streptomyces cavernae]|uniref:ABC transporter permease n=1 Tax=Streptomyces cavernae TaxID=2259034 RepID=UPI000FEBD536|nr:ABC transporter permease [Streptomyces cavernae]
MSAVVDLLAGGVTMAVPVLVAASGELVSERTGILNLSLEGMVLTSAFAAVYGSGQTDSPVLGTLCGVLAGLVFAGGQAVLSVTVRANQMIVGIAANTLALGITSYGSRVLLGDAQGRTVPGFQPLKVPLLHDIPVLRQSGLAYVALALVVVLGVLGSRRTGLGLALDAVGADAAVADQAGLPVRAVRYGAVLTTGLMAGLAGAQLALSEVHAFTDNMTSGLGYLAIVAVIAGRWRMVPMMLACLFFGVAQALQFTAPAMGVNLPVAILVVSPYLIALLAVSGLAGRSRAPAALAVPFVRKG